MIIIQQVWLIKLLLAHLLTDFIVQPKSWVSSRNAKHFASEKLYFHGIITGLAAWFLTGWQYWPATLVIMITHTMIDGWKSYRPDGPKYFIIDQLMHLLVIGLCWYFSFLHKENILEAWQRINSNNNAWAMIAAVIFLTTPAGILIGQLTKGWREKIENPGSLANAGKWIGMIERIIVLILVMMGQFSAISLLIAAKGIIRFNEKDRPEVKTEYLVIGTLMSIGIAIITGVAVKNLMIE
ncbi:MAG: DUF3307 domain-containing protein [Chitinophagaceae bacterium]|nr:DUF3307 domain-containing protein [Chitinophagaceae bacterium]